MTTIVLPEFVIQVIKQSLIAIDQVRAEKEVELPMFFPKQIKYTSAPAWTLIDELHWRVVLFGGGIRVVATGSSLPEVRYSPEQHFVSKLKISYKGYRWLWGHNRGRHGWVRPVKISCPPRIHSWVSAREKGTFQELADKFAKMGSYPRQMCRNSWEVRNSRHSRWGS